jgi:gliding motility-associated-like protein
MKRINYNVVVSGACPTSVTSNNRSLTINSTPVIITQPSNQTVCLGDEASFTVVATGTNLTYQWRIGNVDLVDGGSISGATTATLTIDPTVLLDEALNYNVVVSGACPTSVTSNNRSLTINSTPVITTQPSNQTVCLGDEASFTVVATGTNLTYQWRIGNVDLVDGGSISGATTATLTIDPTVLLDEALNYNVVVSGACPTSVTSNNRSLTINSTPVITTQPSNQTVCLGDEASFKVVATGTNLTYQWRFGNVDLVDGGSISGATTATLTIDPTVLLDEANNYNVVVSGACLIDVISSNVSLVIKEIPIATATSNAFVCFDGEINLFANTYLGATYNWVSTTGFTSTSQNPTILTATSSDAGIYSLTITLNGCVSTPSDVVINTIDCDTIEFFIPEGFSPNGDKINDLFVIRGIEHYPNNTISIFNRWGNKVYDASSYLNTWDGNSNQGVRIGGEELPVGSYFYILDLGDGSDIFKGVIYLNR